MVGSLYGTPGEGVNITFVILRPKASQAAEKRSIMKCKSSSECAARAASSAWRKSQIRHSKFLDLVLKEMANITLRDDDDENR